MATVKVFVHATDVEADTKDRAMTLVQKNSNEKKKIA